jgi:hypothetical protein
MTGLEPFREEGVSALSNPRTNPNVIYVGFTNGAIQLSTDGGLTFTSLPRRAGSGPRCRERRAVRGHARAGRMAPTYILRPLYGQKAILGANGHAVPCREHGECAGVFSVALLRRAGFRPIEPGSDGGLMQRAW